MNLNVIIVFPLIIDLAILKSPFLSLSFSLSFFFLQVIMNRWTLLCIFTVLPSYCLGNCAFFFFLNIDINMTTFFFFFIAFTAQRQLSRIEPLQTFEYQIAPRPRHFFEKRGQSPSLVQPKNIEFDDHLVLTLQAYNTTFHLNLEPNLDLFHLDAVVHQHGKSEKLRNHKVYKGHVIAGGWARIMIQYTG